MGQAAKRTRENRTITVDFQDETTYFHLLGDGKAFVELVLAFILSLGFPAGRSHHLAYSVYDVSRGVHRPAALRLAVPPDATRGGPRCPVGHAWWPQFGAVRGALSRLAHGALPLDLRSGAAESGASAYAMWPTAARLFPGG